MNERGELEGEVTRFGGLEGEVTRCGATERAAGYEFAREGERDNAGPEPRTRAASIPVTRCGVKARTVVTR